MDEVGEIRTVRGEIVLPTEDLPGQAAHVIVQVEDVSRADAPSIVIGEERQRKVALRSGGVISFGIQIPVRLINQRHTYSVRVHIDVSGSGEVEVGDLVSTQTYPVLTRGYGDSARIQVRRV